MAALLRRAPWRSLSSAVAQSPGTKVTTLSNGLRVATLQMPFKTATVGIFIDAGSRFETEKNNGTAHFLEHMAFKGTAKRMKTELELEVENMGALLNAFTSREQTAYYMKCFGKDRERSVEFLSDILLHSVMQEEMVSVERDVILLEMKHVNDQPEELVFDNLHSVAYSGSALGLTILGPEENVKTIQRQDLLSYIQTHYTGPRMVLAACGGIEHSEMVDLGNRYLGALPATNISAQMPPCPFRSGLHRQRDDSLPLVHFAIAVEGVSWSHPDYFPLMVACSIIGQFDRSFGAGQNLSSRLAQATIARGLAHRYATFHTSYSDTGLWGIFGSTEEDTVGEFIGEAQREMMRLGSDVSEEEVVRARSQLRAALMFEIDGTTPSCLEIGRQLLTLGRHITPKEIYSQISAVDVDAVRAVAKKYIVGKAPAASCIGRSEGFPTLERLKQGMLCK